ncbi:MAG: M23 family metallopeptidase [Nitrospinaceae bacterium]
MYRPTVLDNQNWPGKKPRRPTRPGMMVFALILIVNAAWIVFNFSAARIEAKIGFMTPEGTGGKKFTSVLFPSSKKVREARVAGSPAGDSQASVSDTFRLSGGTLEGKEVRTLRLTVQSSLTFSVCRIVPENRCQALAARIARKLSWFLDVDRKIRKGDKLALIYENLPAGPDLKILKMEYFSGYLHKKLEMNFFKTPEMNYGSYFDNRGKEVIARLDSASSPIRNYSEITALPGEYRQGNGHAGTDFKARVGTPVYSSFRGRVTRANWNTRRNGYCVEIDHPDKGVKTLYLHLAKVLVRPGQRVGQGMKIGLSGSTGRSYAPHLHYEIKSRDRKKTVYNPFLFKYHKKYSRIISKRHQEDFKKAVRLYDSFLKAS